MERFAMLSFPKITYIATVESPSALILMHTNI